MLAYDYPGVYINEVESGARPIEATGTSTAAFLGYARTGEAGNAVLIESFKEYTETFGKISDNGNAASDPLAFSVRAFFQNGGRQAYIINVSKGGTCSHKVFYAGRGSNTEELFTVKARGAGSHADGLEVWLTPEYGPSSGIFSFRVMRRIEYGLREEESYTRVDLSPGLPGSLEQVVNNSSKLVKIELATGLEEKVFPSVSKDLLAELITGTEDLPNAVLSSEISRFDASLLHSKNLDLRIGSEFGRSLTLSGMSRNLSLRYVASVIQEQLRTKDLPLPKAIAPFVTQMDSYCKIAFGPNALSGSKLTTDNSINWLEPLTGEMAWRTPRILSDADKNAAMNIMCYKTDGSEELLPEFEFKGENITDLISRFNSEAVGRLKFEFIPNAFTITITGDGDYNEFKIMDLPNKSNKPSLARVLRLFDEGNETGKISDITSGAITTIDELERKCEGELKLSLNAENVDKTLSININIQNENENVTNVSELTEIIQSALEPHNFLSSPSPGLTVEVVENRLLLWDTEKNIAVLDSPAGARLNLTESHRAVTKPLHLLQGELSIGGELKGGKNGKQGQFDDYEEALQELETYPDVSILCLPGHQWSDNGNSRQIIYAAIRHAQRQGDRMVIVDPPKPKPQEKLWRTENDVRNAYLPASSYSALYYPWFRVPVPRTGSGGNGNSNEVLVPPCGFAAGVWSATDKERGVWKAPAGVDAQVSGISSLQHDLTDSEGGALNRYGVNVFRNLPGYGGSVVWGGRTLATKTEPQWKYLSVRRTALMIEDSLRENMLWAVHQPNRSELWAALRINIEAFMNRLFRAGAFQPDAASKAYFVKCGLGSTMTQGDIDAGIVRVRIGFAPVKPAEFVVIDIEQINENS